MPPADHAERGRGDAAKRSPDQAAVAGATLTAPDADADELVGAFVAALERRGQGAPVRDGRRLRTERGRAAVIAATLALVDAGDTTPTFADIARESGVSERTIFRYFPDREALLGAVALEALPTVAHCFTTVPPEGDLRHRVEGLVVLRVELAARTAGFARAVDRLAPSSRLGAAIQSLRNDLLREQIDRWLADGLARARPGVGDVIDVLLSAASVSRLRTLAGPDTSHQLTAAVLALLEPEPEPDA